ncbi:hypothetical protein DFH06DRAFT_1343573 [Mycena polygramma]|nr:hypothetical protein DFH06DRAFT_1343573 [Mycena polygramma]
MRALLRISSSPPAARLAEELGEERVYSGDDHAGFPSHIAPRTGAVRPRTLCGECRFPHEDGHITPSDPPPYLRISTSESRRLAPSCRRIRIWDRRHVPGAMPRGEAANKQEPFFAASPSGFHVASFALSPRHLKSAAHDTSFPGSRPVNCSDPWRTLSHCVLAGKRSASDIRVVTALQPHRYLLRRRFSAFARRPSGSRRRIVLVKDQSPPLAAPRSRGLYREATRRKSAYVPPCQSSPPTRSGVVSSRFVLVKWSTAVLAHSQRGAADP